MMKLLMVAILPLLAYADVPLGFQKVNNPMTSAKFKGVLDFVIERTESEQNYLYYIGHVSVGEVYMKVDNGKGQVTYQLNNVLMKEIDCEQFDEGYLGLDKCGQKANPTYSTYKCVFEVNEDVKTKKYTMEEGTCTPIH